MNFETFANTSFAFGRRDASYTLQQIEDQTTEVRKCRSFFKNSVIFLWYKLLSNAGGLWPVFLPLSSHKLMNEIVEESQRFNSESYAHPNVTKYQVYQYFYVDEKFTHRVIYFYVKLKIYTSSL